ncbi:MAG: FGGY-family carbohydrate kinase [Microcoleaceae cyanobacterium]
MKIYLGIDFGTSGARAAAIDQHQQLHLEIQYPFSASTASDQWPLVWQTALFELISRVPLELRTQLQAICMNGTSATVLLCDSTGTPLTEPLLYDDNRGRVEHEILQRVAPAQHPVLSATSSLAKLFWWQQSLKLMKLTSPVYFLHQADWLGYLLHGKLGFSDYHNALKLGYDVGDLSYPRWLTEGIRYNSKRCQSQLQFHLPCVLVPGTPIGCITVTIADRFQLPHSCQVCAGTTDSIAAFLASGAAQPGEAVTSLGSTLVIKLLSQTRVDRSEFGIYSHRLGNLWLPGGASNTGGAVLRQFFTDSELETLSHRINANQISPLEYYPLPKPGERFPINDPTLSPRLEPRPENDVEFLQGLLEGIARIEALGYQRLQELGATPLTQVYTAGGGAKNSTWTAIRGRHLQVPMLKPTNISAAYGSALLALKGMPS